MYRSETRQRLFIKGDVQGILIRRLVRHFILLTAAGVGLSLLFQFLSNPFASAGAYLRQTAVTVGPALVAMLITLPIVAYDIIRVSNRIVGPIYRLRRFVRSLANGESVGKLVFRDGDYWPELANDFNRMVQELRPECGEDIDPTHNATVTGRGAPGCMDAAVLTGESA